MTIKKSRKNKYSWLAASFILFSTVLAPISALADFNPSNLIDDKVFSDTQTFGSAAGIQQFLVSKNSVLANGDVSFLLNLREPPSASTKLGLEDPGANVPRLRTAAELIWDASVKTGLNPQVILVKLQKEQSLITASYSDSAKLQRALDFALGFGCPDGGGCEPIFKGFYFQLFGNFDAQGNRYVGAPGSLMRSFTTPNGRGPGVDAQNQAFGSIVRTSRINDTIIISNTQGPPNNAQPTQSVTLSNAATAALYRYTPHVYNGNYNFWKFFQAWFKYPNGTLIKLASDSQTYIINNGLKSLIPNFVIVSRNLNAGGTIIVSPTEFSDYVTGPLYGPADNVLVKIQTDPQGKVFVFQNSIRHPASDFVLTQRGLNPATAILISQADADLFTPGTLLAPKEGTLIQAQNSKTVYVISEGKKKALSAFTFKQYQYAFKNIVLLPSDEVGSYSSGGFMLPKEGTLLTVKDVPGIYILQNGLIKPVSDNVFKLYRFSKANIVKFSDEEIANAGLGGYLPPPDGTYYHTPSGAYYYYKNGSKHHITPFVFKQRSIARIAVTLSEAESAQLDEGTRLAPRDNTLIKGDQSQAIYVIKKGQKVGLDFNTWVKTYGRQKPTVLAQEEVDSYPNQGDEQQ